MKPLFSILVSTLASTLGFAEEKQVEPLEDGHQVRVESICEFHQVDSDDKRVSVNVVGTLVGGTSHPVRLIGTVYDPFEVGGDSLNSTTFEIGYGGGIVAPMRMETVHPRLYRFTCKYAVSDTFEYATLDHSYELHLDEDGKLVRIVPTVIYSSMWEMNGSKMGLIASGPHRSFYYVEPKPGSDATPGTLFFHGTTDGKTYSGKILNWFTGKNNATEGASHIAEGEIRDEGTTVVLKSRAVEWKNNKNVPVGPETTQVLRLKLVRGPSR